MTELWRQPAKKGNKADFTRLGMDDLLSAIVMGPGILAPSCAFPRSESSTPMTATPSKSWRAPCADPAYNEVALSFRLIDHGGP
jgi:hypothetical protein